MKLLEDKKIPYSIRRVIPMVMLAGATLFMTPSCKRDEPDDPTKNPDNNKIEQPVVMRDVELYFDINNRINLSTDTILKYNAMKDVRTIYLVSQGRWNNLKSDNITNLKNNLLVPTLEASSKTRGRGDFDFKPGEPSKVPEDSLWYVQNGWTIGKRWYSR